MPELPTAEVAQHLEKLGVSRETQKELGRYVALLVTWQRSINLIGPATVTDIWYRHILDSAQILPLLGGGHQMLLDVGSGAGLPGLVIATCHPIDVHLIDSDQRKAVFLREAARQLNLNVTVHASRIENMTPMQFDIITARAVAPFSRLLPWVVPYLHPEGKIIALKGRNVQEELTEATNDWKMETEQIESVTARDARVVVVTNLAKRSELPS